MKYFIMIFFVLTSYSLLAQNKGITQEIPKFKLKVQPVNLSPAQPASPLKKLKTPCLLSLEEGKAWNIIPAGSSSAVKFNYSTKKLESILPDIGITNETKEAVKSVPRWLRPALFDNMRRLSEIRQRNFAAIIINAEPEKRDEIAFSVAHLAPRTLNSTDPQLLVINAEYIYTIAPDLQYVELVEYDDAENWHTTTKYRVLDNEDSVWVEIPKEIYYWWIVMPKLSDEQPLMNSSVYNEFWRQHIYYTADEGFPTLKDALKDVKLMWDLQPHHWKNEDSLENKIPFGDSLFAVQAVGRWTAHTIEIRNNDDIRPVQPNQILHHHNGNCGENQDLLNAGCRTALLPVLSVGSWPGDHVWNELWWNNEWWYYQVSWDCGPTDFNQSTTYPSKGLITAWRSDLYTYMVNEHYNPVCTLTVKTKDPQGKPVEGAQITFFCAGYSDPHAQQCGLGSWGYTDINGELTVLLGTDITYGFRADSKQGHNPAESNRIIGILYNQQGFSDGGHLTTDIAFTGTMPPDLSVTQKSETGIDKYKLVIDYKATHHIMYGDGYWQADFHYDNYRWNDFREEGIVDFFICDGANYSKFINGDEFEAYEVSKNSKEGSLEFNLPSEESYYIVYSNKKKTVSSQLLQNSVYVYGMEGDTWTLVDSLNADDILDVETNEVPASLSLKLSPNPVSSFLSVNFAIPNSDNIEISVYNLAGLKIKTIYNGQLKSGNHNIFWNCTDNSGKKVSNGLYLIRFTNGKEQITEKVIIVDE